MAWCGVVWCNGESFSDQTESETLAWFVCVGVSEMGLWGQGSLCFGPRVGDIIFPRFLRRGLMGDERWRRRRVRSGIRRIFLDRGFLCGRRCDRAEWSGEGKRAKRAPHQPRGWGIWDLRSGKDSIPNAIRGVLLTGLTGPVYLYPSSSEAIAYIAIQVCCSSYLNILCLTLFQLCFALSSENCVDESRWPYETFYNNLRSFLLDPKHANFTQDLIAFWTK